MPCQSCGSLPPRIVIEKSTVPIKTAEAIARVLSANEAATGGSKNLGCREWMEMATGFEFHEEATPI